MVIAPEFSQLNPDNTVNGIPGIDTRRAQTTVQLREGQTIALAGLIAHRTTAESSRFPMLGAIPLVGPKFFSGKTSQDETELLILVTPEIVRPMDAEEVPPVPGHDVTLPNDCEFYRCGLTEGMPDPSVYQAGPYGSGHAAGVPVGYRFSNTAAGSPPVTADPYSLGVAPPPNIQRPPVGEVRRGRQSRTTQGLVQQDQPPRRLKAASDSGSLNPRDIIENADRAAIQQAGGTFESTDANSGRTSAPGSVQHATRWYQRPFRSFDQSESAPQRPAEQVPPNASDANSVQPADWAQP
jgi:hypothetical protein